jgi:hypothetical protein
VYWSMCSIALHPSTASQTTFKGLRPQESTGVRHGCCSRDRDMVSFTKSLWSQRDIGWCIGTFMMPLCESQRLVTLYISP